MLIKFTVREGDSRRRASMMVGKHMTSGRLRACDITAGTKPGKARDRIGTTQRKGGTRRITARRGRHTNAPCVSRPQDVAAIDSARESGPRQSCIRFADAAVRNSSATTLSFIRRVARRCTKKRGAPSRSEMRSPILLLGLSFCFLDIWLYCRSN